MVNRKPYAHYMKTIYGFSFLVIMFFMHFDLPAESADSPKPFPYTFSLGSSVGFLYGQGEEIVYKTSAGDDRLSQLLWDMKPLFYIGTALNFSQIDPLGKWGFFADLSLKFGIPTKTGVMEDRDWLADNGSLTNFSSHDNYTQGAFLLDFSAGLSFPIVSKVLFKVYLAFSYMYFSWASQNGYFQYAANTSNGVYEPWDASIPKIQIYGPTINYSQEWLIFSPGIGVQVPFFKVFSGGIDFQISPLTFCTAQDEHFTRNLEFIDKVYWGLFLEPKGTFSFSPHPKLDITLSVGYRFITGTRGTTYRRTTGTADAIPAGNDVFSSADGTAGAGYAALDTGLSVKIRF